ncbi:uncharacterized protein CC84DRAFT_735552 [Paraphaeosphaeria sporulosa]|uniref:Uncharacterized protein n=1 Tax=Paraphaeosphaeria sporulosa TaxID=1460663 RepID=A0A177CFR6_9PLEO|nr:uncharacterized protein CC84DRAFT_735552 [Paraphaeosphaeria sporulosa]OAG05812.1 hypothetical protein CC84DRAFT_735552 [Paraphaeosphaeria sporulosa]
MPRINFTECAAIFAARTPEGQQLRWKYGWNGTLVGIDRSPETQISREGCLKVCGQGAATYPWDDVSSTITTWLLPVVGTLLQAPFESNAFGRTLLAITRWVGSPIASLSYVLWNIKVSAKAALMVDMAVPFDRVPDRKTDFGSMRDSMYLLLAMNQYTMEPTAMLRAKEAEGLLRIALFSKDLKLTDTPKTLRQMRRILARELREIRRRGAVPVFVSIMWFLFAFALSIQAAFGVVGENRTAHDLALGCMLAWFPILIMATIVDRNPIAAEAIRKKLNALINHVRHALRDERHRQEFIDSFSDQPNFKPFAHHVHDIAAKAEYMDNFFVDFAGQARIRWHYGAAHPVLSDIENCYIADKGRNWLANEREARTNLVLGPINDEGLVWFDIREFWQVAASIAIVLGSCGGAFILSFFTPTVGLGCRSGGYTIFFCISLGLMIMEMIVWLILSPYEIQEPPWLQRTHTRLQSNALVHRLDDRRHDQWGYIKRRASSIVRTSENLLIKFITRLVLLYPFHDKDSTRDRVETFLDERVKSLKAMSPQRKWEWFFFRPLEAFNTIWLVYIVVAQTWGFYKTCDCVTSNWGGAGGYLDFRVQDVASKWVEAYWLTGTLLTSSVMGFSMFYITVEWCQQSFLSTEDYEDARQGLQMTRIYRHWTFPFRRLSRLLSRFTFDPMERFAVAIGLIKYPQKTLLWSRTHTHDPDIALSAPVQTPRPHGNPSIELSDFSTAMVRDDSQHSHEHAAYETPAMAHSLFPPAIPQRRPRQDSDASAARPSPSLLYGIGNSAPFPLPPSPSYLAHRPSHDSALSSRPLLPRPSEAHHQRERAGSATSMQSDERDPRSSGEENGLMSPVSPLRVGEYKPFLGMVQSRQGYSRANSDPGSPPGVDALGIRMSGVAEDLEKGEGR